MIVPVIILVSCIQRAELVCVPEITKGSHSKCIEAGHVSLECDLSACSSVSKVQYEKQNMQSFAWNLVFEATLSLLQYHAFDTDDNYTLKNRSDYIQFPTYHILHIKPLTWEDQGTWRCVVYDQYSKTAESKSTEISIAQDDDIRSQEITIQKGNTLVTLACSVVGHHVSPTWLKDGMPMNEREEISDPGVLICSVNSELNLHVKTFIEINVTESTSTKTYDLGTPRLIFLVLTAILTLVFIILVIVWRYSLLREKRGKMNVLIVSDDPNNLKENRKMHETIEIDSMIEDYEVRTPVEGRKCSCEE